ncbi:MAG: 3-dehydroquinate dehydratase [Bacteroidales bacterium]|nr:3-dehydroquinate dehydratase [Bacteroidales bacterium]
MKLLIINGPNINLLGFREPEIYGTESYRDLEEKVQGYAADNGHELKLLQSNHEGELVDWIQGALFDDVEGIVINPGAYTHTSIALLDAVKAVGIPTVEVHISKVEEREDFRQVSYIRKACIDTVTGRGIEGYIDAIKILENRK